MADIKLRVTPEKLISTSSQFQQSGNSVKSLTKNMLDIANQLKSTWNSEAATVYYGKLNGLNGDMQKLDKMIAEHVKDLQDIAKVMQEAEKQNQQTANALKTDEIV